MLQDVCVTPLTTVPTTPRASRRIYDLVPAASATDESGSRCSALARELFHRNHLEELLRPTTNLR